MYLSSSRYLNVERKWKGFIYYPYFILYSADRDFEPPCEEEDDEETIEVEEQQEGNDAESHRREIELLKEEGTLPLDQLLSTLKLPQVPAQRKHTCLHWDWDL